MTTDNTGSIAANAMAMERTRVDGPPAPVASPPVPEPDNRPYPTRYAEAKATERAAADAARTATLSPAEQTIATLRKHPAFYDGKHAEHADVMQKYKAAIAAAETPEETAARAELTPRERREAYAVPDPALPPVYVEQYNQDSWAGNRRSTTWPTNTDWPHRRFAVYVTQRSTLVRSWGTAASRRTKRT